MKTWEVFKALAENPTDEYEATRFKKRYVLSMSHAGFYYLDIYNEQGELIPKIADGSRFNGNIKHDFEWEKVLQPVTWQEAIEAWINGNGIVLIKKGIRHLFKKDKSGMPIELNRTDFTDGKWYIL